MIIEISEDKTYAVIDGTKFGLYVWADPTPNQNPTYTRAEVLREEWKPKCGSAAGFFRVFPDNRIIEYQTSLLLTTETLDYLLLSGSVFAPTRELAEEIVAIREGKWLPKVGDEYWWCYKNGYIFNADRCVPMPPYKYNDTNNVFFPSEAQRTRYIADKLGEKQKAKEAFGDNSTVLQYNINVTSKMVDEETARKLESLQKISRELADAHKYLDDISAPVFIGHRGIKFTLVGRIRQIYEAVTKCNQLACKTCGGTGRKIERYGPLLTGSIKDCPDCKREETKNQNEIALEKYDHVVALGDNKIMWIDKIDGNACKCIETNAAIHIPVWYPASLLRKIRYD